MSGSTVAAPRSSQPDRVARDVEVVTSVDERDTAHVAPRAHRRRPRGHLIRLPAAPHRESADVAEAGALPIALQSQMNRHPARSDARTHPTLERGDALSHGRRRTQRRHQPSKPLPVRPTALMDAGPKRPRDDLHTGRRTQVVAHEAARPQRAGRASNIEEVGESVAGRLVDVVEPAGVEAWQDEVRVGGARTLERLGKVHQLVGEAGRLGRSW